MKRRSLLSCAAFALATALPTTHAVASQAKQEMHQEMLGLTAQMHLLKPYLANTPGAAELYREMQAPYQHMSDQLGGDDPGRTFGLAPQPPAEGQPALEPRRELGAPEGAKGPEGPPFPVPPGCAFNTQIEGSVPNIPIPDLGTITDTVTISGMTGVIWHLDSVVVIEHPFCADLDFTLTSPSGTTVTYSTDNGGGNANVFGTFGGPGTFFLDVHNSLGALPYTTNDGLVTDHGYVNNVLANVLAPEEAFSAFNGEDPNGVWTLTVTDDAGDDVGLLWGWDVFVGTVSPPQSQTTRTFGNTTPVAISDFTLSTSTIAVSGMADFVCDVKVNVDINHTYAGDLDITLTNPFGLIVSLTTGNGGATTDVFEGTTWTDDGDPGAAGTRSTTDAVYANLVSKLVLTPEEPLTLARVGSPNGTWTLTVYDHGGADVGTLNNWDLTITTCSCSPACPSDNDGNGIVNIDDLLTVINGWGACP
jgi:subtilisin-like proprotein convertase family protein